MGFDYKKWVTENKYGKPNINYINEQEETGSLTYLGCSLCPEGATMDLYETGSEGSDIGGTYNCYPVAEYDILLSDMQNNEDNSNDNQRLYASEYIGDNEQILSFYNTPGSSPGFSMSPWLGNAENFQSGENQDPNEWVIPCSGSGNQGGGEEGGETITYYGCSLCPEGAVDDLNFFYGTNEPGENTGTNDIGGTYNCLPIVGYDVPTSDTQYNDSSEYDTTLLSSWEYIGSNQAILDNLEITFSLNSDPEGYGPTCSGSGDVGGEEETTTTEFTGDYNDPDSYFDNPTGFCADNPDVEYDIYWFANSTTMCDGCMSDPVQAVNIQCCCCPGYTGLPQSYIDAYPDPSALADGWASWGGPNQCDGSIIPPSPQGQGAPPEPQVAPPTPQKPGRGKEDRQKTKLREIKNLIKSEIKKLKK